MLSFASMVGSMRQAASAATGNQMLSLRLVPRYFLDFVDKHAEHEGVIDDFIEKCAESVPIKINHDKMTNGRVKNAEMCDAYQCLKAPCLVDLAAIDNEALRQQIVENSMSVNTSMDIDFIFNKNSVPTIAVGQNKIDYLKSLFANDPDLRIVKMTPLELSILDGQQPALPSSHGASIRLNFGDRSTNGVKVQIENEINVHSNFKERKNMSKQEVDIDMEEPAADEEEEIEQEEGEVQEEDEEVEEEEVEEEKPKAKKRAAPAASKKAPPPKKQIKLNSGKKTAPVEEEEEQEEEEGEEDQEEKEKPKKKIVLKKKEETFKKPTAVVGKKKPAAAVPAKKAPVAAAGKKAPVAAGGKTTSSGKKADVSAPSKDAAKLAKELSRNADTEALLSKFKNRVQQRTLLHNDILQNAEDINAMDIFNDEEMGVLDEFVNSDPLEYEPKTKKEKMLLFNAAFLARNKGALADKIIELYEADKSSQAQESKKIVKPSEANAIKKKASVTKKDAVEEEQEETIEDEEDEGDRGNPMSMVGSMLSNWNKSQLMKKSKEATKSQIKPKPFAKK